MPFQGGLDDEVEYYPYSQKDIKKRKEEKEIREKALQLLKFLEPIFPGYVKEIAFIREKIR